MIQNHGWKWEEEVPHCFMYFSLRSFRNSVISPAQKRNLSRKSGQTCVQMNTQSFTLPKIKGNFYLSIIRYFHIFISYWIIRSIQIFRVTGLCLCTTQRIRFSKKNPFSKNYLLWFILHLIGNLCSTILKWHWFEHWINSNRGSIPIQWKCFHFYFSGVLYNPTKNL